MVLTILIPMVGFAPASRTIAVPMMTKPADLSDEELLERAHQLRLLALRGHLDSRGPAHEHEAEVRRRFGTPTTISAPLEPVAVPRRPFWRFW